MVEEVNIAVLVDQLKAGGTDPSKQVPAFVKLGEWYLEKAKRTENGADFTKADALFNAALLRPKLVDHEIDEDHILSRIVETYRKYLYAFTNVEEVGVDEIRNEIDTHKEFIAKERLIIKKRLDEIDSFFISSEKTEDQFKIHADKVHNIFHDIQDMYIRFVSMLVKECESKLGKPPCDYAIVALGPVARMEATPFSDLEFVILFSDPAIGNEISYFRVLSHFLHLKVINLGETILPALGIEQLNDFESSDPGGNWFYDSETPRGISFDGAMPWASISPLGRKATKDKPALELIRTPEQMAKLQDEEIAATETHLAEVMPRATLLCGERALLVEYNKLVNEKLNTKSSETVGKSTRTIGFNRGINQLMKDIATFDPYESYLGVHCTVGALFDAKKQLYRLISLLLADLGLIFDIQCSSSWEVISQLQTRRIFFDDSDLANIKVCLSIANEIRLKTYLANGGQKELFSPVSQYANNTKQCANVRIFRGFDEDILIRLLNTSIGMRKRCQKFCTTYIKQGDVDISRLWIPSDASSKASLTGYLYVRMQNFPKALAWMKSVPKDSLHCVESLTGQGMICLLSGEYEKSVKYFEDALEVLYQDKETPGLGVVNCLNSIALSLKNMGRYKDARIKLQEAISKHNEIFGESSETIYLSYLMQSLGAIFFESEDMKSAVETFQRVEGMYKRLTSVPDNAVINLYLNMAWSLSTHGQRTEQTQSLGYLEKALQLTHKLFGKADLSSELAYIYRVTGVVNENNGLFDEALTWYKRSLELLQLLFGDNPHLDKIGCLHRLAGILLKRNQTDEAVEKLQSALTQGRIVFHEKPHHILARVLFRLGEALINARKFEESLPYLQEAKKMIDAILGPNCAHHVTVHILLATGTVYHEQADFSKALEYYEKALHMMSEIYGESCDNDSMASVCLVIARVAEKNESFSQAKEYYIKAIDINRRVSFSTNTCHGSVDNLYHLGLVCDTLGEQDEALKYLEEAREIAKAAGLKNRTVIHILLQLSRTYENMGLVAESETCFQEFIESGKSVSTHESFDDATLALVQILKGIRFDLPCAP